jgi:hypothetical protein
MSLPQQVEKFEVTTDSVGGASDVKPSFLEKWGVVFLAFAGGWILLVCSGIFLFFLSHLPPLPNLSGLTADQVKDALSQHKQLVDQWRDSLTFLFDLLVAKTALPIVTLLLGYLFGKKS